MSNYKVGDLASLMSSSPKKSGGKLQSLFDEHYKKKQKPAKNAKKQHTQLMSSASGESFKRDNNKKKKEKNNAFSSSPLSASPKKKKAETDSSSDFLPINNNKKQFKEKNSNFDRKRKSSFSENSAVEDVEKQNVEHSKKVKAFIRCSKSKRQKIAEQASISPNKFEAEHVEENLFKELGGSQHSNNEVKKKKNKRKAKQSRQISSNGYESDETNDVESHDVTKSLLSETEDNEISNKKSKKQKNKKSKKSNQNSSNAQEDVEENEFSEVEDVKNTNIKVKKQKKKNMSKQSNLNSTNMSLSVDTDEEEEVDSSAKTDVVESKMDAEKIKLQNLKDLPCTIFIGNLPVSHDRKMLQKLFAPFGQIKSVRVRGAVSTKLSIPKKIAEIKSEYHKGLQSHTGFVVFKDEESAKNALSLNGTLIDNHHIVVDFANQAGGKKLYDNDLSVFLGNLPFDVDDESVRSALEDCGDIHAVRIIRDKETGLGKGFGYVQFQNMISKEKALKVDDLEINGRKIRIKPIESNQGKKPGPKKTVMMIRNNVAAMKRIKDSGNKKSVKKLLKKGRQVHKKKQIARLLGAKFVK